MNKFSQPLHIDFFDSNFCNKLKIETDNILSKFHSGVDILPEYDYTYYTNILFYDTVDKIIPEIHSFIKTINADVIAPIIGFVPPNKPMGVHTDGYNCSTKILLPIADESPLNFYSNRTDNILIETAPIKLFSPLIFNTNQWHGGILSDQWRINLQIMISTPYDVIKDRVENNTLFKLQ